MTIITLWLFNELFLFLSSGGSNESDNKCGAVSVWPQQEALQTSAVSFDSFHVDPLQ